MKYAFYTDKHARRHRVLLRDGDSDLDAEHGVPADPPDVNAIDWSVVKTELHNQLVNRGLFTQKDISKQRDGITGAVLASLRRQVIALYRNRL